MCRSTIYLVRKRGIGDVLWIEPVIRRLAARYKKVIVHTRYNTLFENYPLTNVSFVSKQSLPAKFFSRVALWGARIPFLINLDSVYEKDPYRHFLHAYQLKCGLEVKNEYPVLYLSEEEKKINPAAGSRYVILHLGSYSNKNYRKIYGIDWSAIASYLKTKGFRVLQIDKGWEYIEGVEKIDTATIRDMISVIASSSLFIGIDSGPSHIAASLKIPALIFFGAVNPEYRHFRELFNGYFLQQDCEFSGCFHHQPNGKEPDCKLVGNEGVPQCSLHTNKYLITHIDLILSRIDFSADI